MKKQYWKDNENGVFMNDEQQMKDLVENGIIESYEPITASEFQTLLIRQVD